MGCCRWPKSIRSRNWNRRCKPPCMMAPNDYETCALCSHRWPPRHNWTFWKRIRWSATSTLIGTVCPIVLPPPPLTPHEHPANHAGLKLNLGGFVQLGTRRKKAFLPLLMGKNIFWTWVELGTSTQLVLKPVVGKLVCICSRQPR